MHEIEEIISSFLFLLLLVWLQVLLARSSCSSRRCCSCSTVASSCFNWRVSTTDAIGIRGEFIISIFSAFTSSTRIFPFNSRLVISTSICSFKSFGKVFTFSRFHFCNQLTTCFYTCRCSGKFDR